MKLYTYFRSSAAYRVRIALNLKGLTFESIPIHLLQDHGQQHQDSYKAINPNALVPTLITDHDHAITQSLAIIEYLNDTYPEPGLLPGDSLQRARVRAIAQSIACDIHPLNNLRVLQYLKDKLSMTAQQRSQWYRHWIGVGLMAVETILARDEQTGTFCHGDTPSLADCCLIPQVFNAQRFDCDLSSMPTILRIYETCMTLKAFREAAPDMQADAEDGQ